MKLKFLTQIFFKWLIIIFNYIELGEPLGFFSFHTRFYFRITFESAMIQHNDTRTQTHELNLIAFLEYNAKLVAIKRQIHL